MVKIIIETDDLLDGVDDHELNRLPCTKALRDAVQAASRAAGVTMAQYHRLALVAKLRRDSKTLT